MGLCQEDATENVCAQVLQLVGIGSPSDAASDYIVKGNNILAIEPNFIKLDDAHLADFLLQLAVLVDGKATTEIYTLSLHDALPILHRQR